MQVLLIAAITLPLIGLPAVQRSFGLSGTDLAVLVAAYGLSFGGLLLLGGRIADLYGGRTVFLTGLVVFGSASAVAALSPAYSLLLVARFVQGAGAALVAPAAMVLLGAVFSGEASRRRALATWGMLSGLGATAGNLASGPLVAWAGWRPSFALPAVLAFAAFAIAHHLFPQRAAELATNPRPAGVPPDGRASSGGLSLGGLSSVGSGAVVDGGGERGGRRVDVAGAVLATVGMTGLSVGLLRAGDRSWGDGWALGTVVGGAVLLALFFVVEARVRVPLLPPGFLVSRRRATGLASILVTAASMGTMWFLLSLYLGQVRGLSPLEVTAVFLPYAAAQIAAGAVVPRLVGRLGPRVSAAAGLTVAGIGLGLLSRLEAGSAYVVLLAGVLVFVTGATLAFSGAMVAATGQVPDGRAGLAGGVANTAMEVGPTAGLAVLVSAAGSRTAASLADGAAPAVATTRGYAFAFGLAAGALLFTAALVAVVMPRPWSRS